MGAASSGDEESFESGLLEYPHYTRPAEWEGRTIPEVLRSGDHARIAAWRTSMAETDTRLRRPDLWERHKDARSTALWRAATNERRTMNLIQQLEAEQIQKLTAQRAIPEFRPGDTLKVGVKVVEGERTRVQAYEGVCIARSNKGMGSSFTVRKISFGEGVERVFPRSIRRTSIRSRWSARAPCVARSSITCAAAPASRRVSPSVATRVRPRAAPPPNKSSPSVCVIEAAVVPRDGRRFVLCGADGLIGGQVTDPIASSDPTPRAASEPDGAPRIAALDILRGLAILVILFMNMPEMAVRSGRAGPIRAIMAGRRPTSGCGGCANCSPRGRPAACSNSCSARGW